MGPQIHRRRSRFISAARMLETLEPRALFSATAGDPSGRPISTTVGGASASVFLSVSASEISYGADANLVAHVVSNGAGSANGLIVDFIDDQPTGNVVIGSQTVTNNQATLTWGSGLMGTHHITAEIEPGQSIDAVASVPQDLTISKGATLTALTESGGGVTANVTVNGAAATGGSVSFFEGTKVLATEQLSADGSATFSINGMKAGTHAIVAAYNGSTQLLPSTSSELNVSIVGAPARHPQILHGRGRGTAIFDNAIERFKLVRKN